MDRPTLHAVGAQAGKAGHSSPTLRVGELQERYEHIWDRGVSPPVRVLGRGAQMDMQTAHQGD